MSKDRLIILSGPLAGQTFDLSAPISMGRNPDNTIQLDDPQVSRQHATVEVGANGAIVRDLGSGNGTYIGDRRILEYRLADGDVICLGAQEIKFEAEDGAATPKTALTTNPAPEAARDDEPAQPDLDLSSGAVGNIDATKAESVFQTLFQAPTGAATEAELQETQRRLQAVYMANEIIASERDLKKLFASVMDQIFSLVPAHNGMILLKDKETGAWLQEHTKSGVQEKRFTISSTIVNQAFDEHEAVLTSDAMDDSRFQAGASIIAQNISSAMCVPLLYQGKALGVIYVDTRGTSNAFVKGDLELLVALAGPAAIAIRNAQFLDELQQSYSDTLIVLANAIELRDHYTVGHTWRVTNFAIQIAKQLGWDEEKLKEVEMGAVLHDVGKIAVDNAILGKAGRLTDEEFAMMKVHPQRGADLLKDVKQLHPLIPYCLYHHERYDGNGYPFGKKGEDIPIEGRLVSVADTFDAMTSNRPYRKGLDPEIAISELEKGKGSQFDPECADAMIACYRAGMIDEALQNYHDSSEKSISCPFCSTFLEVPEDTEVGGQFQCHVCRRMLVLKEQNNAYFGELVRQGEITTPLPSA
jgi:HD-GYP domain-containing protein (c-di-GMP phosphodiesterase class II)/pSer/pThr/pTyr-binding forkhead associated (FHA) protein